MQDRWHLLGWMLFLVCSCLFIVGSSIARDIWALAASIVFLVACLFFLVPYFLGRGKPKG